MKSFTIFFTLQINIQSDRIVQQQISMHKLNGPYVIMIAHSHPMYRRYPIEVEKIEASEKDTDVMKQFPFRVWKESGAYKETEYVHLNIPILGKHPVGIVTFNIENVLNLLFPILSSDPKSSKYFGFSKTYILNFLFVKPTFWIL